MPRKRKTQVRPPENRGRKDELGNDPREIGAESAGQSGGMQRLSTDQDSDNESVEELSGASQAIEAARVEGSADAADPSRAPCAHA